MSIQTNYYDKCRSICETYNISTKGELMPISISTTDEQRLVCLFSCGITSFVATMQALEENRKRWKLPVEIIYTLVRQEPDDNLRFLLDAEKHFGQKVTVLLNGRYDGDIYNVMHDKRYISGVAGAPCTRELKWSVRKEFVNAETDIQVFGFQAGEEKRMDDFANANPDAEISCPLICTRTTKENAIEIATRLGIDIPNSYKKGYQNANCIGCVKGQAGYWNKIREDYPSVFDKQAKIERLYNGAINKTYSAEKWFPERGIKNKTRMRVFLDELPTGMGRHSSIDLPDCGVLCELEQGENILKVLNHD